ncbi:hypothetical protein F66182_10165 [Fusarium sp. NRRL 66182]|nr:hypothetical protein F66182_10165 [Fusarium sp. NRRL 66182]
MLLGPFDKRRKRSRFNIIPSAPEIVHAPGHIRIGNAASSSRKAARQASASLCKSKIHLQSHLVTSPRSEQTSYFFQYFDTFLKHNNFNPGSVFSTDVVHLMKDQRAGTFLLDAVLSLGAMQAAKLGSFEGLTPSHSYQAAVHYYSKSVLGLRHALSEFEHVSGAQHGILWATHLLGLFELMNDPTGQGWIQHLVHGTSKALVAAGPSSCQSGLGQRFFAEIRIFEVCRAIIFNEPTFLADSEWTRLAVEMLSANDKDETRSLHELLDIVVLCSTLRVRASNLVYSLSGSGIENFEKHLDDAYDISQQGFHLRQALLGWGARNETYKTLVSATADKDFGLLVRAFFSATSIYLSGVFDYEIMHWQEMGIVIPNLSEDEIQMHVAAILTQTNMMLNGSSVSPLLVLFPLRVAGARSCKNWQQDCILEQLAVIDRTFPVASAFRVELGKVWARRTCGG